MKKIWILLLPICFIHMNVCSQSKKELNSEIKQNCEVDESGNITYKKVLNFENKSKNDLYDILQTYFAYTYDDANEVIQVEDKANGLLIGKGLYDGTYSDVFTWHVIRIDIKENKVRIIITLTKFLLNPGIFCTPHYDVAEACPISPNFKNRGFYVKMFYKAHEQVMKQFKEIERVIIAGNTSKKIESEW